MARKVAVYTIPNLLITTSMDAVYSISADARLDGGATSFRIEVGAESIQITCLCCAVIELHSRFPFHLL
jgi:hypothetical protein